jgi:hypothetical protein
MEDKRTLRKNWNKSTQRRRLKSAQPIPAFLPDEQVEKTLAEVHALYSDSILETRLIGVRSLDSKSCLSILLYLAFEGNLRGIGGEYFITFLREKSKKHNYSGTWRTIARLLRFVSDSEILIKIGLEDHFSTNDLYGNYLKFGKEQSLKVKIGIFDTTPVIYPQYKRGYKDKGSHRDISTHHGEENTGIVEVFDTEREKDYSRNPKQALFNYLWNNKAPMKGKKYRNDFDKKAEEAYKERRRQERREEIKKLKKEQKTDTKVITYKLTKEELNKRFK